MRFDLYRLGSREFENLTQAIATAEIGPFMTMFGAGPDGGREATFQGKVQNPTGEAIWNGYGVLQAKFKEVQAPPREEATWLIREIRKEFDAWRTSEKRSPKPEYFIIASNVSLSATPGTGGIDRVTKEMQQQCTKLGIRGWAVWHSENICRFLEKHNGIRTSYSAWILPGDILASLHQNVEVEKIETNAAIRSFLARELLKDRYAKLDQAGAADDRTMPLADVFVDLPIGGINNRGPEASPCLQTLISHCDTRHSAPKWELGSGVDDEEVVVNKFVLVGGPGQGKSTASQFMCQLYRAYLVQDTPAMRNAEVKAAVTKITQQAEKESLAPRARRWPFKIVLTHFADHLAQGKCTSVLDYAAQRVSDGSSTEVTARHMRNWLHSFPWLLVLDGLDEVPETSNRSAVIQRVNDFQIEADESGADLVIVATTRPQGYTDEFSPENFRHYLLKPLSPTDALAYGQKLATARHGAQSDKAHQLIARLEHASAESSTAHLMGTPLQVTIMAVLLDRVGKAPKDRYTLFAEYYRVIYERELEKEGVASNLLRDHWTDINSIHADVGLVLQERSEHSGETESRLTLDELNGIIRNRLEEEGHSGADLDNLSKSISRSATERLVFLVPSREGEVSFEIRSLQEFWAADALLKCGESEIPDRLRAMSLNAHWRNVLLFAMGNIFVNRRPLRDSVQALVSELNTHSTEFRNLQRRTLVGSRLAVEILHDGMVRAPRYEATLIEEALKLLLLPPSSQVTVLANCINAQGMIIAQDFFDDYLRAERIWPLAMYQFIGVRADRGDTWAECLLARHCSDGSTEDLASIFHIGLSFGIRSLLHHAARVIAEPEKTVLLASHLRILTRHSEEPLIHPGDPLMPAWVFPLLDLMSNYTRDPQKRSTALVPLYRDEEQVLALQVHRIHSLKGGVFEELFAAGFPNDHWMARVAAFCDAPSQEALKSAVLACVPFAPEIQTFTSSLPWIIQCGLTLHEQEGDEGFSRLDLGTVDEWLALESAWASLRSTDLTASFSDWVKKRTTFFPIGVSTSLHTRHRKAPVGNYGFPLDELVNSCVDIDDPKVRARFTNYILSLVSEPHRRRTGDDRVLTVAQATRLVSKGLTHWNSVSNLAWLGSFQEGEQDWLDALDQLGRRVRVGYAWMPFFGTDILDAWVSDFGRIGLGRLSICCSENLSLLTRHGHAIQAEWEKSSPRGEELEELLAAAMALIEPPKTVEEADRRACALWRLSALRGADISEIIHGAVLDYTQPSVHFALSVLDLSLEAGSNELYSIIDKVLRYQSSAPTKITYSLMRPK
ncbi:NACHT domain-containing protein [Streptomyces sp. NPDC058463]|uniref:NACHT domain-containing protein n=1 Tax=Streptomyces sp. NPDC058463 TaxID=3346510 RepID=UPI00365D09A8